MFLHPFLNIVYSSLYLLNSTPLWCLCTPLFLPYCLISQPSLYPLFSLQQLPPNDYGVTQWLVIEEHEGRVWNLRYQAQPCEILQGSWPCFSVLWLPEQYTKQCHVVYDRDEALDIAFSADCNIRTPPLDPWPRPDELSTPTSVHPENVRRYP